VLDRERLHPASSVDRTILSRHVSQGQRPDRIESTLVSGYAEARRLPRGWAHLALQVAVWFGFYAAYQVARGAADRGIAEAFWNGTLVIEAENRIQTLIEPGIQNFVEKSELLVLATSYTYWLSQFAVVGLVLLWSYFKHHDRFADFRNWLIGANLVGLLGYVLMPTAPPRMFPEWGFSDTLAEFASVNHDSGLIAFASNPYAAMPSLHAMDALIVGIVMASVCRSRVARVLWLAWPIWVSFAVMGTGNHYWLDCVAGFGVALLVAVVLFRGRLRRFLPGTA
jgi:membrane-associated phospholipid phosphatase